MKASLWILWIWFRLRSLQWMPNNIILAVSSKHCNSHYSEKKANVTHPLYLWRRAEWPSHLPSLPSWTSAVAAESVGQSAAFGFIPLPRQQLHPISAPLPFLPWPWQLRGRLWHHPFPGWRCQLDHFGDNHTCSRASQKGWRKRTEE